MHSCLFNAFAIVARNLCVGDYGRGADVSISGHHLDVLVGFTADVAPQSTVGIVARPKSESFQLGGWDSIMC
jgi:hypothetical protein